MAKQGQSTDQGRENTGLESLTAAATDAAKASPAEKGQK